GEKKRFSLGVFSVPCFLKKQLEFSQLSIDFLPLDLYVFMLSRFARRPQFKICFRDSIKTNPYTKY
ncbi:hypothetical protein, partial [Streptococcus suis]|uniref:hypothetical protein n=1 Tax=Streptococcus suis TaxID=1307 RepID=UPI00241271A3